eukprot:CCRYP_016747-RD/>CCRYP_016747-RD protein AED:0.42 eAED:0.42 QI:0/0.5/0.66/1/0.5/0.33/3/519/100
MILSGCSAVQRQFGAIITAIASGLNATATEGALIDLTKVIQKQHDIASKKNEPCSGIVYVHKREDCVSLAARISKVILCYLVPTKDQKYQSFHLNRFVAS